MTSVGILETGRLSPSSIEKHGDFPQMFRDYLAGQDDLNFETFPVIEGITVPNPNECDAWIITGSSFDVVDDLAWISSLRAFIKRAVAESTPLLGVCFGHQLMAQTFGARVERSPAGRGVGVHSYTLTGPGKKVFEPYDQLNLVAAHQCQVVEPPPAGCLLATSSFCKYAAFAYGNHALSLQAHPEFTPHFERHLIKGWQSLDPVDDSVVEAALHSLDAIKSDAMCIQPVLAGLLHGAPLPV